MMAPRDPNEVEQTLLPGAPAEVGARAPARPAKPTPVGSDTPPHPAASDATIDAPVAPVDPGATLASIELPAPATSGGFEATLMPSSTGGAPGTVTGGGATGVHVADPGATLPSRPSARSGGSAGPLGSDTSPASVSAAPGPRLGASPSATGTMVGRFALRALHASGGLGEVFTARDTELNREVAVKRIKSQYADDPGSRSRFLTEAELTARLDHPGVVPVFGLVSDVRGRPCYAMRFIRGETLKDEIDRYHGNQKAEDRGQKTEKTGETSGDPGLAANPKGSHTGVPQSVAFRHLLARFIATCQAIAYAHSRGIIHRDIKPANIMVGTFGETLVVDWGLAKSLDDGPDPDRVMTAQADAGFRRDPESTDMPSHMTMAGTAVGTPAYMAPEQAAGEVARVGPRADIYALGATLFVILTGKAPVSGKTTVEVLDRVRRGAFDPASAVNPEAPKPLDAIARKAMALRQEDRYATALELSADVERWLSDEPVSCYRDPFPARAARWGRRHPARVAAGASLLLAGVLAAGGVAWAIHEGEKQTRIERDNVRDEQQKTAAALVKVTDQEKKTAAQRDRAEDQEKKTEVQRARAVNLGEVATGRYAKAVAAYNVLVNDIDKEMADRAGTQDLRTTLLLAATDGLQKLVAGEATGGADRTLVAAYRQMGEVYQLVGATAKARASFQHAVEQATRVQADARTNGTTADKRAADRDLGRSHDKLGGIYLQAGDTKAALEAVDRAIALFEALAEDATDAEAQKDLAAARVRRAAIRVERGQTGKALEDCDAALAARQKLAVAAPTDVERKRDVAASLDALAGLQLRTGRTKEALASAQTCLEVRADVRAKLPRQPDARRELADAHARLGEVHFERARMTDAVAAYRVGLAELQALADEDKKSATAKADLAAMYGRLGHAQLRTGDIDDAVANTRAGKALAAALQAADPDSARARGGLALACERYGDALLAAAQTDEGIAEYAAGEKLRRHLHAADTESARARLDLARALERVGDGRLAKEDAAGAVAAFEESVAIRSAVAGADDRSAGAKQALATGLYKMADAHCRAGRPGRAEGYALKATELFVDLAGADAASGRAQRDVALAYGKWGQVLSAGGHNTGALIVWQSSLDRCKALATVDAGDAQAKEDEAAAWERLATFYAALGNTDRALESARTAVGLWKKIDTGTDVRTKAGRRRLALALLRHGDIDTEMRKWDDARASYQGAANEAGTDASDPLLGPVAKRAAQQQVYADAVAVGLTNPAAVLTLDAGVRVTALRTVATLELRADRPANAGGAAGQLATIATTAADKYEVARVFAGCAASARGDDRARNADAADAVKHLKLAVAAGFRDAEALTAPEWDAVGTRAPEFAQVRAGLEKLSGSR